MHDEDTRTRLLHAAGAAFAEQGFKNATVRAICQRAGSNLASVNYHFGDKEQLYAAVLRFAHERQLAGGGPAEWPEDAPPETKLREFIRATMLRVLAVREVPWHDRLMLREMLQPTGACREIVEDFIRPHFEQLLGILDELIPSDTPHHKRHQVAFSIIGQCLFYRFHDAVIRLLLPDEELNDQFGPEQLADHVADVALAALGRERLFPQQVTSHGVQNHPLSSAEQQTS